MTVNTINLYNDGIGYVENLDFSTANISEESRVNFVQKVASICYKSPAKLFDQGTGKGRSLYDRLYTESLGLPSSSFELIPVLLKVTDIRDKVYDYSNFDYEWELHTLKYGELLDGGIYVLTNLRALLTDVGDRANEFFNTSEEEIAIIKKHFKVFKTKIPLFTARQFMRHRCSWQELSRRYVSGKKQEFEFYVSPKLVDLSSGYIVVNIETMARDTTLFYEKAIAQGASPQDARQVLPQSMYTEMYSAWYPSQLKSMLDLRTQDSTQTEFRELAKAMERLVNDI